MLDICVKAAVMLRFFRSNILRRKARLAKKDSVEMSLEKSSRGLEIVGQGAYFHCSFKPK